MPIHAHTKCEFLRNTNVICIALLFCGFVKSNVKTVSSISFRVYVYDFLTIRDFRSAIIYDICLFTCTH